MSACPRCAIDLPPRHELADPRPEELGGIRLRTKNADFLADVLAERARLAMLDPAGEHDAVATLDGVRARQILLHLAEPGHRRLRVARPTPDLAQRDLLDRLGVDADRGSGMVRCPGHEDRAASLSWRWDGSRALLHCFAGCSFDQIRRAL
ncbi:MAG: hypothetical protein ABSG37_13430 [Candidatus Limnocylindrales bacterium]